MSCVISHRRYTPFVTSKRRDRDWSPEEVLRRKPQFPRRVCGFVIRAPIFGGSTGGRKPGRFRKDFPVDQPVELPPLIGLRSDGFCKPKS